MNEKEKEQETQKTAETEQAQRDKSEAVKVVEKANAIAERMEAANKKAEELIVKQEALAAQKVLAGRADAGTEPEEIKELTPEEYAEKLQKGEVNPFKEDGLI